MKTFLCSAISAIKHLCQLADAQKETNIIQKSIDFVLSYMKTVREGEREREREETDKKQYGKRK